MQTLETLDALMGRIIDLDQRKIDLVADTRKISLDLVGGRLVTVDAPTGVEGFVFNDHARGQLATDLGIPKRYFDRMGSDAPQLLATNVNHWLANDPSRRMVRGYRDDGGESHVGRAWLSDGYRRLDHVEIARRLLPEFENMGSEVRFHHAAVTDDRLYIRAVLPAMQAEIKVGDPVQWGVDIRNSEVGSGTLSISGFVLRLVCTNGMTVARALNARHFGKRITEDGVLSTEAMRADDKAFWLVARDVLRATISEVKFEEVVAQLRAATEGETISRPIAATEVLQQRYSLSDDERETVLAHLTTGGDLSRWGALNAITASAQAAESFDRRAELEGYGWDVATMKQNEWERVAVAS